MKENTVKNSSVQTPSKDTFTNTNSPPTEKAKN